MERVVIYPEHLRDEVIKKVKRVELDESAGGINLKETGDYNWVIEGKWVLAGSVSDYDLVKGTKNTVAVSLELVLPNGETLLKATLKTETLQHLRLVETAEREEKPS